MDNQNQNPNVDQFGSRKGTYGAAVNNILARRKTPIALDELVERVGCSEVRVRRQFGWLRERGVPVVKKGSGFVIQRQQPSQKQRAKW